MPTSIDAHPFDPIIDDRSRVLFLGSFPSLKSFEEGFYYAHPRNQFWPIMEALFNVSLPTGEARRRFALEQRIALWDVYASVRRLGANSSDANLGALEVNDFDDLFGRYRNIERIYFTGAKAEEGFRRRYRDAAIPAKRLPSTSPAHASMTFAEKLAAYREVKDVLDRDV